MDDLIKRLRSQDVVDFTPGEIEDLTDEAAAALEAANSRLTALESERDALLAAAGKEAVKSEPVAWAVYWGIGEMRPNSVHFEKQTATNVAAEIKSNTEIRPLYTAPTAALENGDGRDADDGSNELIRSLQKALFYWMPSIAGEESPAGQKAAEHSYLLFGLDDNSMESWGDQMLQYVGIMNRQQEKLEIVLRDAGLDDESDYLEFIEELAARAAPKSEPVAWRYDTDHGRIYLSMQCDHTYIDADGEYVKGVPLYLGPTEHK